jgi:hypothetical protein
MSKFMGQLLPPLRAGKTYCMEIYPGGRKLVKQCNPELLVNHDDAIQRLRQGRKVFVALEDAVSVLLRWRGS